MTVTNIKIGLICLVDLYMAGRKSNTNFGYFIAELLILVLGISASFALNEYRVARNERAQEDELLASFKENLVTDSLSLFAYVDIYKRQIEIGNSILNLPSDASYTDSTARNVLGLLSYSPFAPRVITYQEMKSLGRSHIIQNDSLLSDLIRLYEVNYEALQVWIDVDGQHVKERMIPHLMQNFPYVKGLNFATLGNSKKRELMKQINSDEYRYLVQFGVAYKTSTKGVYEGVLQEVRTLIDRLNSELSTE